MKPLIGKRIGATKSFRCLVWTRFSGAREGAVYSWVWPNLVSVHCNQLDDQPWAQRLGPGGNVRSLVRSNCSFRLVVARLRFGASRVAGLDASELPLNTDWRNENHLHEVLETKQLATCGPTRSTVGSKLGVFEFRLARYQWGNSWCLYSFCLIGRRLGLALFGRATIGSACELIRNANWQ